MTEPEDSMVYNLRTETGGNQDRDTSALSKKEASPNKYSASIIPS